MKRSFTRSLAIVSALAALTVPGGLAAASPPAASPAVTAASYQRGPAPTLSGIRAKRGPFAFSKVTVTSDQAAGAFGGGTIYYPNDTSKGTFGGIAVSPGFQGPEVSIAWLGPRLASQGFVVFTIATRTVNDQPAERGDELLAALDYLTGKAPAAVQKRLDPSRLAVTGHSMGGGGVLSAAKARPGLKAAAALAPWHLTKNWSTVTVPTLIESATKDDWAPADSFAEPMYESLTRAPERAYAQIADSDHLTFTRDTPYAGALEVAWMKRFVDGDSRYSQFLCPGPDGSGYAAYRASCPIS
ncbi:dienelactone hydrolase family protein [Actinomadura rayongensis]|uniref:Poly(ethylene terephthalate) hydrolase n=1 Tax=Actinomadura rayongensis TaxID=1429076 RepID=A0A6I4WH26_9ACTN|nr:phosphohydrolase [Actinomadura rayongensis]MXQ66304.1 phosphohydrolase [Actinomadura rayongensis]